MSNMKRLEIGDMISYIGDDEVMDLEILSLSWVGGEKFVSVLSGFDSEVIDNDKIDWERTSQLNGWSEPNEETKIKFLELQQLVIKALNDGKFGKGGVRFYEYMIEFNYMGSDYGYNKLEADNGIKFINELYLMGFAIDTLEDLRKIKVGAKGFMMNEVEFEVVNDVDSYTDRNKIQILIGEERFHASLEIMKGSYVKQRE